MVWSGKTGPAFPTDHGGAESRSTAAKGHTPMSTDVARFLRSPLIQSGSRGDFVRLVLSEAAKFGMPGKTIALLDDTAAMLGYYKPLLPNQSAHVSGPLVLWRTHPDQPSFERVHEVEKLVFSQRALLAFGGGKPGHLCGTAEILVAMGNIIADTHPPEYYEVFQWASLDVLPIITGHSVEQILSDPKKKGWKVIPDDDVLKPGGRLHATYVEIATTIRREAIKAVEKDPDASRRYLRPVGAMFIENHTKVRAEAVAEGLTGVVERLDEAMATIQAMFPNLSDMDTEIARQTKEQQEDLDGLVEQLFGPD